MNEGDHSRRAGDLLGVRAAALVGILGFAPSLAAQITVTASAPVVGNLQASSGPNVVSSPLAVGPVASGTFGSASAVVANTQASWSLVPTTFGSVACEVESMSSAISFAGLASASGQFTLDLQLQAASGSAQDGVLILKAGRQAFGAGSASVRVDVGADGTFELGNQDFEVLVPISVSQAGVPVRVELQSTASAGGGLGLSGQADAGLVCEFVPGHAFVERFANLPTLVYLDAELVGVDRWALELSSPLVALTPFVTVFGFQPTHAPLGPGLVQLVTVDTVLLGGSFVFDVPPLPAGFEIYAQGVVTDGAGAFATSNSVRVRWF